MRRQPILALACAFAAVALTACDDADPAASTAAVTEEASTTSVASTSTGVYETSGPEGGIAAAQSIVLDSGTLHYTLPSDVAEDPMPMPNLPPEAIGYAKWFTDCRYLKVVVQSFDPPMPAEEAVGTFTAGGLDWTLYDSGPRDGTNMEAKATGDFGTVIVGAQVRFPGQNADPAAARSVVEAVGRTVSYEPNS